MTQQQIDLIIHNGTIITMNANREIFTDYAIAVDKGNIVAIAPVAEISARYKAATEVNAQGMAVMPGLINTHTHIPMTLFRGIADDLALETWLYDHIFPAEAKNVNEEFVRAGTRLGALEMLLGGTTTIADMYYFCSAIAEETSKAGLRAIIGYTLIDFPSPHNKSGGFENDLQQATSFVRQWKGNPLVTPALAPHAPYSVSGEHLQEITNTALELQVPLLIHIAETKKEFDDIRSKHSKTPTQYLHNLGLFRAKVIAAHMVWTGENDHNLLAEHNVGVAHCPQSNMKLASGAAPVPAMLKDNVLVGLGTDGCASNNDVSMWEEMDVAAKLHKLITSDPTVLSAEQALEMATIGGAKALGLEKNIGSLEVGKYADIILVGLSGEHQIPLYNVLSHLVYTTKSHDVQTVIVHGKVVVQNRVPLTLNPEQIKQEARKYALQVQESLKK